MRNRLRGSLFATLLGPLALTLTLAPSALAQGDVSKETSAEAPAAAAPTPAEAPAAKAPATETPSAGASTPENATPASVDEKASEGEASAGSQASASTELSVGGVADAQADVKSSETGSTEPPAQDEAAAAPEPMAEAAAAAQGTPVVLEVVPASGYPAWQVRGIDGGSLAATMHGMQFPYLPAEGGRNTMRVGVSGYLWNDLSYARIESGLQDVEPNQKRLATQTRGVLRFSPTFSTTEDWFVQGVGELVVLGDQILDPNTSNISSTDDAFVRAGKWKVFDITAGRFQAWEIANHYGMALDINTLERDGAVIQSQGQRPAPAYGLTYFWDRKDLRLGHYAAHIYPTDYLRFEMLAELGTGSVGRETNFRPTGIFDVGFVKVKGGFEYGTALPQGDGERTRVYRNGFGGAVQFVFVPWLEGGVHFARGFEDRVTLQGVRSLPASNSVTGYGGFLNGRPIEHLVIGIGVLKSHWENLFRNAAPGEHYGDHDTNDQLQSFVAVQYDFWDQFYMKLVGSHAKFDFYESSSTPFSNEMWGIRYRMAVAF